MKYRLKLKLKLELAHKQQPDQQHGFPAIVLQMAAHVVHSRSHPPGIPIDFVDPDPDPVQAFEQIPHFRVIIDVAGRKAQQGGANRQGHNFIGVVHAQ